MGIATTRHPGRRSPRCRRAGHFAACATSPQHPDFGMTVQHRQLCHRRRFRITRRTFSPTHQGPAQALTSLDNEIVSSSVDDKRPRKITETFTTYFRPFFFLFFSFFLLSSCILLVTNTKKAGFSRLTFWCGWAVWCQWRVERCRHFTCWGVGCS